MPTDNENIRLGVLTPEEVELAYRELAEEPFQVGDLVRVKRGYSKNRVGRISAHVYPSDIRDEQYCVEYRDHQLPDYGWFRPSSLEAVEEEE